MEKEIFVDSPIFPDRYLISNYGNVYSKYTGTMRKLCENDDGYYYVRLWRNGKAKYALIHRLVAMAFVPNDDPENKTVINHKDGNKKNNYYKNLEWCDVRHNTIHSYRLGLQKPIRGSRHGRSKYNEEQIHEVCRLLQDTDLTIEEIAKATGVSMRVVQSVRARQNWKFISKDYLFYDRRFKRTCND